jgi:GNAT superfamily N-acetyltransferase
VADYTFTVLAPTHNVGAFSCGDAEIDEYLHRRAAAEQALNLCQVYVMADGASRAWAYGTLSPVSVTVDAGLLQAVGIPQAPYRAIGGYLLGRLGVDGALQKRGIGRSVVARLARIAAQQRDVTGGVFLAVDAKSGWLVSWYEQLGFRRLDAKRRRLVLPLASLP